MEDDEDFQALFFSEARELLEALQEHLNLLADGAGEPDTVHAAFRAVHSVKGGAAAFGFDQLIAFAHIFETVMDLVREDKLELTDDIAQILLRSGDMMQILLENAEAGSDEKIEGVNRLKNELEVLAGVEPTDPAADTPAPADADAPAPEPEDSPEVEPTEIVCRFSPDETFFEAGHDMLRLIRGARDLGLTAVHPEGEVPKLADLNPRTCSISWELTFLTDKDPETIEGFFQIYAHLAKIEFFYDEDELAEHVTGDDETPPSDDSGSGGSETGSGGGPDGGSATGETGLAAAPAGTPPKAKEKPARAEGAGPGKGADMSKSLRVEITRIDRLVNLVGEMLITQAALAQQISDGGDTQDVTDMAHAVDTMSRQLRELQESVMAIRAQPVRSVFRRMPRVVRDLADKLGKQAKLELAGENTEVDATVIEELAEPLVHMIRNSMDHGLEANDEREQIGKPRVGNIRLAAEHRGERVIITIEDDGRGVNRERVLEKAIERGLLSPDDTLSPEEIDQLIFHPGFSTAAEVSSVSGRGVGMDVVKKKIVSLGGRCTLTSNPGKGTRFVITLPLTLAVMDGMTICVGQQKYILPLSTVVEALRVSDVNGKTLPDGTTLLERRGEYLRLLSLRQALNMPPLDNSTQMAIVVDTETNGLVALTVDELIGQRQIVLKSLEANFHKVDGISGATILGDGQVALILDVPALMQLHGPGPAFQEMMH